MNEVRGERWFDLRSRAAAVVMAILLTAVLLLAGRGALAILVAAATFGAGMELSSITSTRRAGTAGVASGLAGVVCGGLVYLGTGILAWPWIVLALAAPVGLLMALSRRDREGRPESSRVMGTGLLYFGMLPGFLLALHRDAGPEGILWVILVLAIAWCGDIGAYLAGRAWGKHRIAPSVSPRKSLEGAAGSLVSAFVPTLLLWPLLPSRPSFEGIVLLTIVGNLLAQIGDLLESRFKRAYGVKDSGSVIPGGGGVLDCIDGLCLVAPWVYLHYRYLR